MEAQVQITLTHHDFMELKKISEGNMSKKIKEILQDLDEDLIREHLTTDKTTCRLDLGMAGKLQEMSDKFQVAPGRIVRALIEAYLHSKH